MPHFKDWIIAFRLRTLPLALSSIFMGSFIAAFHHAFRWDILLLASLTTLFLQILSNLANDYGDAMSGADHEGRLGPERMVQSGKITPRQMKIMMVVFVVLSLITGLGLIYSAFRGVLSLTGGLFFLMGIGAIVAAIKYTVGRNPFGYRGRGDIYVFLFFGLAGVCGTYFLHTNNWNWEVLLPAVSVGLLSAGVLNVNNIRDEETDRETGKRTLVVHLGGRVARYYHVVLIGGALISLILFIAFQKTDLWSWLFLLVLPLLIRHVSVVVRNTDHDVLDPELKRLAISTLFFVLLTGAGLLLSIY